jgi:hypothetical protein
LSSCAPCGWQQLNAPDFYVERLAGWQFELQLELIKGDAHHRQFHAAPDLDANRGVRVMLSYFCVAARSSFIAARSS